MDAISQPLVFVDIETSGGSPYTSRIIEVAVIRMEDGRVVEEFTSLVNPGQYLSPFITKLTGIKPSDVIDAPYFDEIAHRLYRILDGAVFVAHCVGFDYSFIKRQLEGCGLEFTAPLLCTARLSRALYPAYYSHSLEKIIQRHSIAVKARHRAYDDAKALVDFLQIAIAEHGPITVKQKARLR